MTEGNKKNIAVVGPVDPSVTLFGKLTEVNKLEETDPRKYITNVPSVEEVKSLEDINRERVMKHIHGVVEDLMVESSLVDDLSNARGMGNGISFFELILKIKVKYHGTTLPKHTKKKHPRYLIVDESYIISTCTDIGAYVEEFKFWNPHLEVVGVTTPLVDYLGKEFDKFKEKQ